MTQTIKQWLLKEQLKGTLLIKDIALNGCSGGVYGLTMYYETSKFYDDNQKEIWDELNYYAMEYKSVMDMLSDTNIGKYIVDDTTFKNSVVWFVVESIANRIEDESVKVAQMFNRSDLRALLATIIIIVLGYAVMHLLVFLDGYYKLTIY